MKDKLIALFSPALLLLAGGVLIPNAEAGYHCRDDFLGGYRCRGDINGVDIDTRTRPGIGGGWNTNGTIGGESFDQRCRSDLLGGYRCD